LRKSSAYLNARDYAAIEDFMKNAKEYMLTDFHILQVCKRLHKREKELAKVIDDQILLDMEAVTNEQLKLAGVSKKELQ